MENSAVVFIPLTQGKVAIIDFEDFEKVRPHKWSAEENNGVFYASSYLKGSGRKGMVRLSLHRLILNAPAGVEVDHRDGDGLNNQRSNIRIVSPRQNRQAFRRKIVGASSRFRGVSWNRPNKNWTAQIKTNRKKTHLGSFKNEEDAARAYDKKALELFGEFASLNFPT